MRSSQLTTIFLALAVVGLLTGTVATPVGASAHDDLECSYPLDRADATGTTVTIDESVETVVTLAPSAAQTMWELDADDKVIGVSMHATLDGVGEKTNVSADPMSTDIETVVDLDPDLVLAPNVTPRAEIDQLRGHGVPVFHFATSTTVEDVIEKTALFGELVDECDAASDLVTDMETRLANIDATVESVDDRPKVLFTMGDGFTAGANTFQSDALERAGLTDIAIDAGIEEWGVLSEEYIVSEDPGWIVYPDTFPEPPVGEGAAQTTAWELEQIIVVDSGDFSQPAPRLIDAIEHVHLEVYGEVEQPTPTPIDSTPTPAETPTPAPDDNPGFSVAVALLAIAALAFALARRH